ncbi:GldG family protein [Dorea acetigenes]|uniref:GldG family protein n=1 Tax=Dorea acetigenes TaxID=2981787 RepID=A0ABT2RLT2_9FIRM|nr:GldG family protein [Dorea acetigenes]MCU6686296.1 GldG family protein [Dorea acetigenes]SCI87525.1 gliding-associated putative ABC transporter substrate-binding component GldG [uncultured Clostridium sp.]
MLEKIKKIFRSTTSRNGSYSVGMIVLVIGIAVVVNMIAGQIPESYRNIDVSDNKIYEITDTSREMLKSLDKEIKFTVFAEKDSTDERIQTFLKKYTGLSDKIEVEWVDPVLHPSELTENNMEADGILISCEETGKSTSVTFDDILVTDEYSYYMTGSSSPTEFDGEGQFTSAINFVASGETKKLYYTSGHGEQTFSSSVTELLEKNNIEGEEVNLLMTNEIPEDCELLMLYAPTADISEEEKERILSYMSEGGKVFIILGEMEGDAPNLDALLNEYGMQREEGYIADMQRNYQGNYYYIFPEITATGELAEGLSSDMVLLVNAHGLTMTDAARDTISVTEFMQTSSQAYAVTEETQEEGTYTLGAVATETISSEEEDAEDESSDSEEETKESRLTVVSSDSLIDSQLTDNLATLENLDLFMNAVTSNFDDTQNVAIEAKSLEITYNTMKHTGVTGMVAIVGIPALVLLFGFMKWWKRRKA